MAYTQNDLIRSYIDDVVPHTLEAIVEHMWLNILSFYFPSTRRFGIEREASISPRSEQRANVCLTKLPQRLLANDPAPKRVTVIMIENKCCPITSRHPAASLSPPPPSQPNAPSSSRPRETTWRSAKIQLTNYMINVRNTQHVEYPYDLYGIVGIGQYVKFYSLKVDDHVLQPRSQETYHITIDAVAIDWHIRRMQTRININAP